MAAVLRLHDCPQLGVLPSGVALGLVGLGQPDIYWAPTMGGSVHMWDYVRNVYLTTGDPDVRSIDYVNDGS